MLQTSPTAHIGRENLGASDQIAQASNFTIVGFCSIDERRSGAGSAFLCGMGGGTSSNFCGLRRAGSDGTGISAIYRAGGAAPANTWTTSDTARPMPENQQFFFAIRRNGSSVQFRVDDQALLNASNGTTENVTDPNQPWANYSIGAFRTGAGFGDTLPCKWRQQALIARALTDEELDTLYNGGVASHEVWDAFFRAAGDQAAIRYYADLTRDAGINSGILGFMINTAGTPTYNADDASVFPGNDGRDYADFGIVTQYPGFIAGWDFTQGNLDPSSLDYGVVGIGPDGEYYDDGTNELTLGSASDISLAPAGATVTARRVEGGLFGRWGVFVDTNQEAYIRGLRENLSPELLAVSGEVTILMFGRMLARTLEREAVCGMWHEGMSARQFALFANLQGSESVVMHTSSDGGATSPFDFNYDLAKSNQSIVRGRRTVLGGTFSGSGGAGTLKAYLDGVFEERTPDGAVGETVPARGNPHVVDYDELYNPTGTAPTNSWELWSGFTVGAVPTNLNSPTPPSSENLPTLENEPKMIVHGIAVFNRALSDAEMLAIANLQEPPTPPPAGEVVVTGPLDGASNIDPRSSIVFRWQAYTP